MDEFTEQKTYKKEENTGNPLPQENEKKQDPEVDHIRGGTETLGTGGPKIMQRSL